MKLKCVAKISSVYWQSNEESVESDKHQRIPVLESRETVRQLDKSTEDKQLKKSRRPAAATSAAAAAAASSSSASESESIARISLYALPVLIAFLCNGSSVSLLNVKPDTPTRHQSRGTNEERNSWRQHDRCLLAQLSEDSTPCR